MMSMTSAAAATPLRQSIELMEILAMAKDAERVAAVLKGIEAARAALVRDTEALQQGQTQLLKDQQDLARREGGISSAEATASLHIAEAARRAEEAALAVAQAAEKAADADRLMAQAEAASRELARATAAELGEMRRSAEAECEKARAEAEQLRSQADAALAAAVADRAAAAIELRAAEAAHIEADERLAKIRAAAATLG